LLKYGLVYRDLSRNAIYLKLPDTQIPFFYFIKVIIDFVVRVWDNDFICRRLGRKSLARDAELIWDTYSWGNI
jgi:hypothetical protein